jgi:hypothetical protein
MQYNFHVYVHFSGNASLLNSCIDSLLPRIRQFSTAETPIVILNNTQEDLSKWIYAKEGWMEVKPPVPLIWATAQNWLLTLAKLNGDPFAFSMHTDVEILDGALEETFAIYERVKDTKWYCIFANECFGMHNLDFFYNENVWYDAFLFPMYYSDNHIARIAFLRGYKEEMYYSPYVLHHRSHTLRDDPAMQKRNNLNFPKAGEIYAQIWGGLPRAETNPDPYANGLFSRNN